MLSKRIVLFSVLALVFQFAAGDSVHENEIIRSPFSACGYIDSDDIICNFTNCSYARGQPLQKFNYMKISSIGQSQPPGYLLKTQLFIRGDRNCHIVLSTHDSTTVNQSGAAKYNIVIGGFGNDITYINKKSKLLRAIQTPQALDSVVPYEFSIAITRDGRFEIRKQNHILISAYDSSPIPIKFIKFGTFESSTLEYFYNCSSDVALENIETKLMPERPAEKRLPMSTESSVEQLSANATESSENRTEVHAASVLQFSGGSIVESSFHWICLISAAFFTAKIIQ